MSCFSTLAMAQLPNSGQTLVELLGNPPMSVVHPQYWFLRAGYATLTTLAFPDASPVITAMKIDISANKGVAIEHTLTPGGNLHAYGAFSFWIRTTATREPQFVYLVDGNGASRWFRLVLQQQWGWQRQQYLLNTFVGQDSNFNIANVVAVRFHQDQMVAGDQLFIGAVTFEVSTFLDHAESASAWYVDIGGAGSTIATSVDAVGGRFSVLATLTGIGGEYSQVDIATRTVLRGIAWNLSGKSYLSFYYKDNEGAASHYCLIYDKAGYYREWVFNNSQHLGKWINVIVNLQDKSYVESGPVDLSQIAMFEVGIFGLAIGDTGIHVLQVDELLAY